MAQSLFCQHRNQVLNGTANLKQIGIRGEQGWHLLENSRNLGV
jgi:hypothetical protein